MSPLPRELVYGTDVTLAFRIWLTDLLKLAKPVQGRATLAAGTATVSTVHVTAASNIHLSVQSLGTVAVAKPVAVTARTAGTSFTITSSDNTDTSVIAWQLI